MTGSTISDLAASMIRLHGKARAQQLARHYCKQCRVQGDGAGERKWAAVASSLGEFADGPIEGSLTAGDG